MSSAEGAVQQYQYASTFPLLLNLEGQPTYFMALKDASSLVTMYAMVNVQQYQIVATGTSVAECQQSYLQQLVKNNLVEEPVLPAPDVPDMVSVLGVVEEIRSAVINGNTHYYLRLGSTWYCVSIADAPDCAILNVGDEVQLESAVTEGSLVTAYSVKRK